MNVQTIASPLNRRAALGLLAAGIAAPLAAGQSGPALTPAARLRALIDASSAAELALDPLGEPGRPRPAGTAVFIDPLTDAHADAVLANKRRELAELQAIDRGALTAMDAIAYDVFAYKLQTSLGFITSGLAAIQREAPLNPSFGLHVSMPDFVSGAGAGFATVGDYEAGLDRLTGFTGFMDTTLVRLRQGMAAGRVQPKIIVENVLKQVDAMLALSVEATPFYAAITRMPADFSPADRVRLTQAYTQAIAGQVLPAFARWQAFLTKDYAPKAPDGPGRASMPGGDRLYAAELARHTTTSMGADAIHALGLQEVARIRGEMEKVRGQVGFKGDLKALFEHVRTDPKFYCKDEAELLARFAEIEGRIWKGIPALFHNRPKAPFRVAGLPALGGQRGTGYYKPGPPDGVTPGTLFFNMAMLNTRPIPTLETLTLHEGIPGHHFQITLARENTSLPPLLRYGSTTAYSEGWGLYVESLGRELGMFKDPWQWFGHLDMEMLRAVRLVVDTGLHARGWSRQRAIDFMMDNTSMAPRDVAVEIDRYIAQPGQACAYKIGELTFARLRREATAVLGPRFDVRDFHGQCIDTGGMPLAVLEAKITAWIKAGGGRQA
ncbi:uncharacterized protein (DUF885 family) [Polymorphobacter multimanifer]|uniref:Uncharacterized protein (DUF885 family) n=1 Tax=Polymorphobacter multimanifer TaxID=1070431 RepID=A0A841LGG6_9SPHN|nr:DUF885 domain-containing protein [Polymorphobacter multimanifer]MBB6228282.1 uncharacterized protein (DUF885 family) [Polymorphobacter multimanifer]